MRKNMTKMPMMCVKALQKGFTLIEMVIVMSVIVILIGIGITVYQQQVQRASLTEASAFFERSVAQTILSCQQKFRNYTACDKDELELEGLPLLTAFDGEWEVVAPAAPAGRTFVFTYNMPDEDLATSLVAALEGSDASHIPDGAATNAAEVVTVNVLVP